MALSQIGLPVRQSERLVTIGLSTGGVEREVPPPEFDMGGHMVKRPPPEFQEMQPKKYNVNISDAAIVLSLKQHRV